MEPAETVADCVDNLLLETERLLAAIGKHYDGRSANINSHGSPYRCISGSRSQLVSLNYMIRGRPAVKEQGVSGEQAHPDIGAIPMSVDDLPEGYKTERGRLVPVSR